MDGLRSVLIGKKINGKGVDVLPDDSEVMPAIDGSLYFQQFRQQSYLIWQKQQGIDAIVS